MYQDKEYLTNQYVSENKTIYLIAEELSCSPGTIWKWMKRFGISMTKVRPRTRNVVVKCSWCSKPLDRFPSTVSNRNFCSYDCYHSWMVGNTTGENSTRWQGGITRISSDNLKTPEFRAVKKEVLASFPMCVLCGNTETLHVHHIKTRREYPELAFVAENLITLCRSCHSHIKGKEKDWEDYFVRLISKGGELLGHPNAQGEGNQQPSRSNVILFVDRKVQRLTGEDSRPNNPDTSAAPERDEIVRAYGKL